MEKENKKKILLIVDPQFDFVHGSMKVNGADNIMTNLRNYIENHFNDYACIVITKDWHPKNHISFKEWPMHCVAHSKGAEICDELIDIITDNRFNTVVLTKGTMVTVEEYSIMKTHLSSLWIKRELSSDLINEIDVCGIAGDYCVLETVKDLIPFAEKINKHINVLMPFIAYINSDEKLNQLITDNTNVVSKIY